MDWHKKPFPMSSLTLSFPIIYYFPTTPLLVFGQGIDRSASIWRIYGIRFFVGDKVIIGVDIDIVLGQMSHMRVRWITVVLIH